MEPPGFLVGHVAGIIELKQAVKLDATSAHNLYGIRASGNVILCVYKRCHGLWGITISELGPDPALMHFILNINQVSQAFRPLPIEKYILRAYLLDKSNSSWCLRMLSLYVTWRESTFTTSPNSTLLTSRRDSTLFGNGQENPSGSVEASA